MRNVIYSEVKPKMPAKNPSEPSRSGIGFRLPAIGFVVAGCAIALATMLDAERRAPA